MRLQKPSQEQRPAVSPVPARSNAPEPVLVWDWPLRTFHWALAFFVVIAWFTPNKYDGLHRFAGYIVLGLIIFRLGWAFSAPAIRDSERSGGGSVPCGNISGI